MTQANLLSISAVCKMTGFSRHTMYRAIRSGDLKATKNPGPTGQFRVSEVALTEFLEARTYYPSDVERYAAAA
jgi:excisionase family DNA binding protein